MDTDPASRCMSHRAMAGISLVLLLLAWGAYDDITTDPTPSHAFELSVLLLIAAWFVFVSVRLRRSGYRVLFVLILVLLAAAGISTALLPPVGAPIPAVPRTLILAAFVFLLSLAGWLCVHRVASAGRAGP